MKIERIPEMVPYLVAASIGLLLAIVAGTFVGAGESSYIFMLLGVVFLVAFAIWAKDRAWLLIPFAFPLTGKVALLPLPFAVRDLCVMYVFLLFLILYALKGLRRKAGFDLLDGLAYANIIYLVTVFVRNPAGVAATAGLGGSVGGKSYFDAGIGFLAYLILSRAPASPAQLKALPFALVGSNAMVAIASLLLRAFPGAILVVAPFYISPLMSEAFGQTMETLGYAGEQINRIGALAPFGTVLVLVLVSLYRPATLANPLRVGRFLAGIVCLVSILLSGFRNAILRALGYALLSTGFRGHWKDMLAIVAAGSLLVAFVCLGQGNLFELPLPAQRALSFLPGKWNPVAVSDAQNSVDWRVQMWEMVLTEDKWINDWWLGDGFGFSRHELSIMQSQTGFLGASNQESALINGVFHSGPLSSIRYAGFVGLALYLMLLAMLAIRSWRLIDACRGTPLFPYALMVGLPLVYAILPFLTYYGAYDQEMPGALMACGMVKLMEYALLRQQAAAGIPKKTGDARKQAEESPLKVAGVLAPPPNRYFPAPARIAKGSRSNDRRSARLPGVR